MSDKPEKSANWLGELIGVPGPATWISSRWRHFLASRIESLLNPKFTLLTDAGDGNASLSKDAPIIIGPGGWSATFDLRGLSAGGGGTVNIGGVNYKTTNYTTVSGDNGFLVTFNSTSALSLTLPASPPSSTWFIAVQCIGSGGLTINRNGLNIDTAGANLVIGQNQGLFIYTDGSNYFTSRGLGAVQQYKLKENSGVIDGGDYCWAKTWDGSNLGSTFIKIQKPYKLRTSILSETIGGIAHTYTYALDGSNRYVRTNTWASGSESELITPDYLDGDDIYVSPVASLGFSQTLIDINADGRAWAT